MILQQLYESLTDHAGRTEYSYAQFLSHTVLFFKLAISGLKILAPMQSRLKREYWDRAPPANVGSARTVFQQMPFTLRCGRGRPRSDKMVLHFRKTDLLNESDCITGPVSSSACRA